MANKRTKIWRETIKQQMGEGNYKIRSIDSKQDKGNGGMTIQRRDLYFCRRVLLCLICLWSQKPEKTVWMWTAWEHPRWEQICLDQEIDTNLRNCWFCGRKIFEFSNIFCMVWLHFTQTTSLIACIWLSEKAPSADLGNPGLQDNGKWMGSP